METILVLLHTEADGSLSKQAWEACQAARAAAEASGGGTLAAGVVGAGAGTAAERLGGLGAQRVLSVEGEAYAVSRYATDAAAAEALAREAQATLLLAPGTPRWSRALPGVAQRLNAKVDTHVTALSYDGGALTVSRWYYRQRIEVTLAREARPWVVLLDGGAFPAWAPAGAQAQVELVAPPPPAVRTRVEGVETPASDRQTIRPDAPLLFVAGAGWTKKQKDGQTHVEEAATLIADFVARAPCSLGSSKSLVDLSGEGQAVLPFLTHLHQVGQTGSTPRHPKGLATCCHGEEPHVVGWRFIADRRAVNLDANCGWARGKADVLYVADAFAVMRHLNALLGG
jgi:electron transfer flavoprotein alpha subunit